MRLQITHSTIYRYSRTVNFGRHRLVLRPREGHDLRVERMQLQLAPAHHLMWVRDVFGNSIALVDWLEPAEQLSIVSDVIVERLPPFPARNIHQPWKVPFPARYDPLELPVTSVYQSLIYPDCAAAVREWLDNSFNPIAEDSEGTMLRLCELVHRAIRYQRRVEKGVQDPSQTLSLASGSCRDMATLMMESARQLGVAARFASGYLHCAASMSGRASTHAWTELYLPTLGWRGFDPTTGTAVSLNHVVTGVSTHPRGVMPISGAFVGSATDYRRLDVTVETRELIEPETAVLSRE